MNSIAFIFLLSVLNLLFANLHSQTPTTDNRELFLENLKWLNNRFIDPMYFCSSALIKSDKSSNNSSLFYWILRNKKCMNFSDTKLNFYEALNTCKRNTYYSANSHLIHRKEVEHLQSNRLNQNAGLDILQIYGKLNGKQEFTLWLEDNLYADFYCQSKDMAPIVRFNSDKCQKGCFECESRNKTRHFYACVKNVDYKVPVNSYCNTNNLSAYEIKNNNNLYFQAGEQVYVCQGELKCVNFVCKCLKSGGCK
jgi:hypothetical protein